MTTTPPRGRLNDVVGVMRRNPSFARAYAAQVVSYGGDWFAMVALQGLVLDLTGSASLAGLMFTAHLLPMSIVSLFAGVVVDRLDRRLIMIATDVARGLLALGLLLAHDRSTLWIAFVCVGLMSVFMAFFDPASSAILPSLVREEDLPAANVLMGSTWGMMLAVGAALGGLVAATLGREAAYIGDAVSFAVSALLLVSIRGSFRARPGAREEPASVRADLTELFRFARRERRVGALLAVKGGFGLSAGVVTLISVFALEVFRAGDAGTGLLFSARGVGALVGPFLFRRIFGVQDRALFRAVSVAFVVFGLGYALLGWSPWLWVAALGTCIGHLGGGAQWTTSTIGLQRFSPDHIRGRVFGADYSFLSLTMGISLFLAGVLADRFGARSVAIGFACVALAWTAVWTATTRRWWPEESAPDAVLPPVRTAPVQASLGDGS